MSRFSWSDALSRWRVPLGFLIAFIYFLGARPSRFSILTGAAVALAGILCRAWASGTIRKNSMLAVSGPYAFTRNPLYFGSFVISVGFGWAGNRILLLLLMVIFFVLVYVPVMRREERHLKILFGDLFQEYARQVPFFFPWKLLTRFPENGSPFTWRQYWRNHEYNALLGYCGAVALLFLIHYLRGIE